MLAQTTTTGGGDIEGPPLTTPAENEFHELKESLSSLISVLKKYHTDCLRMNLEDVDVHNNSRVAVRNRIRLASTKGFDTLLDAATSMPDGATPRTPDEAFGLMLVVTNLIGHLIDTVGRTGGFGPVACQEVLDKTRAILERLSWPTLDDCAATCNSTLPRRAGTMPFASVDSGAAGSSTPDAIVGASSAGT